MHTREELGKALGDAIRAKGVTQAAVGEAFGVTQPSVAGWVAEGRIDKKHIPKLLTYFADVVGPAHWGLPFSDDEFALILAFRELHHNT
jgi:predicted XRE-type DNA-binding protein